MGIRLVRGRLLGEPDRAGTELVAVINEATAAKYWAGQDPIGRRFTYQSAADPVPWRAKRSKAIILPLESTPALK